MIRRQLIPLLVPMMLGATPMAPTVRGWATEPFHFRGGTSAGTRCKGSGPSRFNRHKLTKRAKHRRKAKR